MLPTTRQLHNHLAQGIPLRLDHINSSRSSPHQTHTSQSTTALNRPMINHKSWVHLCMTPRLNGYSTLLGLQEVSRTISRLLNRLLSQISQLRVPIL